MLNKHATEAVKALSEKYEFSLEEALEHLDLQSARVTKKEKAEKAPKAQVPEAKVESKSKGKGKAKAAKDDEPKEKKPRKPSGYQAFMKSERPTVKGELEAMSMEELQAELSLDEEPEKLHPKHVMTALGQRWKALSDEEREAWIEQATSEEGEE